MWVKPDRAGRRGEELVLWAVLSGVNYSYVIQYAFRDNGTIAFRVGATGQNLPLALKRGEPVAKAFEPHMHNVLWRIDIDLDGSKNDAARLIKHLEPIISPQRAFDCFVPFEVEGSAEWKDHEFTQLQVTDLETENSRGHNIGYDFIPIRHGTARHAEDFSGEDFGVTSYRIMERNYTALPSYISNQQPIDGDDIVVWHNSPIHHLPRDEDGQFADSDSWRGATLIMWGGFDLRPRDLFDFTPFFEPPPQNGINRGSILFPCPPD